MLKRLFVLRWWLRALPALALIGMGWGLHAWLPPEPRWVQAGDFASARFAPDGSRVLTVGFDVEKKKHCGPVTVWDVATGQEQLRLAEEADQLLVQNTSADFRRWAAVVKLRGDPGPRLWVAELETGSQHSALIELNEDLIGRTDRLDLAPRCDLVSISRTVLEGPVPTHRNFNVMLFEVETGKRLASLPFSFSLALFTPKGDYFIHSHLEGKENAIGIWDTGTRKTVRVIQPGFARTQLSPDGQTLCGFGPPVNRKWPVVLWDVPFGRRRQLFEGDESHLARFSADGTLLALVPGARREAMPGWAAPPAEGRSVVLFNIRSGARLGEIPVLINAEAAFSPDGSRLVVADEDNENTRVRLVDPRTAAVHWETKLPGEWDASLFFDPHGERVAVCSLTRCRIDFFDADTGATIASRQIGPIPQGMTLAGDTPRVRASYLHVSSAVQPLSRWNATPAPPPNFLTVCLDWLLSRQAKDDEESYLERIFDLRTGRIVFQLDDAAIRTSVLSPDGRSLLVTNEEKGPRVIRCFDVPERKPLRWVVGVPLAAGLLLLSVRAGWRRLRRPSAVPETTAAPAATGRVPHTP
jgi:WD40 repeat protein